MTGDKPVDSLYMLLLSVTFMMIFWILEAVWRNERRGILVILIFPPAIFFYIYKYWEETRGRCFFTVLLLIMIVFIGAVARYSFIGRIYTLMEHISIWPYYLYLKVATLIQP